MLRSSHSHSFALVTAALAMLAACKSDRVATTAQPVASASCLVTPAKACVPTQLTIRFKSTPTGDWAKTIEESAARVTEVLATKAFREGCEAKKFRRTNGKSASEVCREITCAGAMELQLDFYHDPRTAGIAREVDGGISINTAKREQGAGGPGNLAHELTHVLGYTHFSNWESLGRRSVPYLVGYLVEELVEQ